MTVIVYVSGSPTRPSLWLTVLTTDRSAAAGGGPAAGVMDASEVRFSGRAIGSSAEARAVLASVLPAAEGAICAVIAITALPPAASVPSAQVTVCPEALQLPWLALAAAKDSPAGSGSVTLTPVAVLGPLLTNDSVYVTVPPATGDMLDATFFRARSTSGCTSTVASPGCCSGSDRVRCRSRTRGSRPWCRRSRRSCGF